MAKTLKQFKQGYTPRSADEKKFVDKHTVQKTPDANGNEDNVFNAKNIKAYDRELEHGYNPGSDEEVYEDVQMEAIGGIIAGAMGSKAGKAYKDSRNKKKSPEMETNLGSDNTLRKSSDRGELPSHESDPPQKTYISPEQARAITDRGVKATLDAFDKRKSVNEGAPALVVGAGLAGLAGYLAKRAAEKNMGSQAIKRRVEKGEQEALQNVKEQKKIPVPDDGATADPGVDPKTGRRPIITQGPNKGKEWTKDAPGPTNPQYKPFAEPEKKAKPAQSKQPVVEKKLTPAEMKKREEVAKAIERENPNMPMAKKMAIATATAKKVAEEKDVPFEGPYKKKTDAHGPKARARHLAQMALQKAIGQAAQDAASKVSKKKVNKTELKDHLLSLYTNQLSEEDNQVLQEMLETEEGTKIAFMISMLIEDEQMLDEAMKKAEKYSHRSFLNKLKQNKTGA